MKTKVFALVDCNSFYASCERIFRPDLKDKPVIVLSNNDGCAIARTNEAKALGIKMGAPYFQIKDLCKKHDVAVFSCNFSLYTNISDRVMRILIDNAPKVQVYSVDEAFVDLTGIKNLEEHGRLLKDLIARNVGLPVGVGIAPTKVLSKVANHLAKKSAKADGVVSLMERKFQDIGLARTPVGDLWGIGSASAKKLAELGVFNAKDFRDYKNERLIQKLLTKVGLQIKQELMGIQCFDLEMNVEAKKEIMCSRTFARSIFDLDSLKECFANYISDAAEKLRSQDSFCTGVAVFARTNPFVDTNQYFMFESTKLKNPTHNTFRLIEEAFRLAEKGFRPGYEYKKAGVRLMNFYNNCEFQLDLFEKEEGERSTELMYTMDKINALNGYSVLKSLACGTEGISWRMNREFKSPAYTTKWQDLFGFN